MQRSSVLDGAAEGIFCKFGISREESEINAHQIVGVEFGTRRFVQLTQGWLSFSWKEHLRNWLVAIIEGRDPGELERLDEFAFSYST